MNASRQKRQESGRILPTLLVLLGLGLLLLAFILSPISPAGNDDGYPSRNDDAALRFFRQNEAYFDRLRSLVSASPTLIYLHRERQELIPKNAFASDEAALNEVLTLMTRLRLISINGPASGWGLRMPFQSEGMAMAGLDRSFWYSEKPPAEDRIFAAFGDQLPDRSGSGSAFCKIQTHWYLRLDWGG